MATSGPAPPGVPFSVAGITAWVDVFKCAVEFEVGGHVYQATGAIAGGEIWERFLQTKPHPTRREVPRDEAEEALASAQIFRVYETWRDQAEVLSRDELARRVAGLTRD